MAIFEDDRPKRKMAHEIGQDLALLSVADLEERLVLLQAEIDRLQADKAQKAATKSAAELLFRKAGA